MKLYLKKLPNAVISMFLASFGFALLYIFLLLEIPAPNMTVHKLGELFYNISLAIIASVVFYYLTIHIPRERARESARWYIWKKSEELIFKSKLLMKKLDCNKTNFVQTLTKTKRKQETGWHSVDISGKKIIPQTYQELYYLMTKEIRSLIDILYTRALYFESDIDVINALRKIGESYYLRSNSDLWYKSYKDELFSDKEATEYMNFIKLVSDFEKAVEKYKIN